MSIHAIAWAFEQEIKGSGVKSLLVALADHADAQGYCYPSQRRLAFMTGQSIDSVGRNLKILEALGFITRVETFRKSDGGQTTDDFFLNAPPERLDPSYGATADNEDRVPTKARGRTPSAPEQRAPSTPPGKMRGGVPPLQNAGGPAASYPPTPPANCKSINHHLKPSSETSSSRPASKTQPQQAAVTTTATQSEKKDKTREPRLIHRIPETLKGLLPRFLEEDRRRQKAWFGLTDEQQNEAFRKAQDRSKQPTEQRAFSTLLKDELDETAGLNVASTTAPHTISPERTQLIESAKQAQEEAYHAALDAGLDGYEAELAGTRAYRQALEGGHNAPNTSSPAGERDQQPDAQTAQGRDEPQTAFAIIQKDLSYQEWTGGNMKQVGKLAALTPEQDQAALQRAMERSGDDRDTHAFALLVLEELRREAGLTPMARPNAQNSPKASNQ